MQRSPCNQRCAPTLGVSIVASYKEYHSWCHSQGPSYGEVSKLTLPYGGLASIGDPATQGVRQGTTLAGTSRPANLHEALTARRG